MDNNLSILSYTHSGLIITLFKNNFGCWASWVQILSILWANTSYM